MTAVLAVRLGLCNVSNRNTCTHPVAVSHPAEDSRGDLNMSSVMKEGIICPPDHQNNKQLLSSLLPLPPLHPGPHRPGETPPELKAPPELNRLLCVI